MSEAIYNLFLRNWLNRKANEPEIDLAVTRELLTEDEGQRIKDTPR